MDHPLLVIAAILALFSILYFTLRNEIVRRNVTCPRTGGSAEVEVVRRSEGPCKPVRIRSCSLFDEPRCIECSQDCLARC